MESEETVPSLGCLCNRVEDCGSSNQLGCGLPSASKFSLLCSLFLRQCIIIGERNFFLLFSFFFEMAATVERETSLWKLFDGVEIPIIYGSQ